MRVDHRADGRSLVTLERYEDLLGLRSLPDYRFVGSHTAEVDTGDLEWLGLTVPLNTRTAEPAGHLFDYQAWIVRRAVERERFAIFAGTGQGKTAMQLDWARLVIERTGGRVLILAPLNVVRQTIDECKRFYGDTLPITDCTKRANLDEFLTSGVGIGITNYEKFDGSADVETVGDEPANLKYQQGDVLDVGGVVLDESSMLKSFGTRKFAVVRAFDGVRFKLCCSATPAPNQRTEFAQHAVFLGQVRSTTEYLTAYFVTRDGDWEFKPHAFDAWVANLSSWAVFLTDPKMWGFEDSFELPDLREMFPTVPLTEEQNAAARRYESGDPSLFGATPGGITSRTKMMQIAHGFELADGAVVARYPTHKPAWVAAKVAEHADEQVIVWVTFDEEGDALAEMIGPDAVHLSGRTSRATRGATVEAFRRGEGPRVLILKPAMFGFGVNLQSCHVQVFSSITDSFERYYQCVRRSLRYGQTKPVLVYVPLTQLDEAICANTMNKQSTFVEDARRLEEAVVARLRPRDTSEVRNVNINPDVEIARAEGDGWTLVHGDAVAHLGHLRDSGASGLFDMSIFSPPFAALYAYSKALGDMGNVRADSEFRLQWRWFAEALLPLMKPGRIVAIHAKEIIRFANTHGYRHCHDFPSDLRDGFVAAGFRYQRRITIWKNPQLEATRNKETSLLHVTSLRDASQSFPQTGEYLMVFTAPGDNAVPIRHERAEWTFEHHTAVMNTIWPESPEATADEVAMWRQEAELNADGRGSVWDGIRETDVLTARTAKDSPEEKHVCPLQLGLIDRAVSLWTNPGELVLSPFAGIGSEGWASLLAGRRFYGVELKDSYWRQACKNLAVATGMASLPTLFDEAVSA